VKIISTIYPKIGAGEIVVIRNRYNPDQPRDPKGESTGGQWTGVGSSVTTLDSFSLSDNEKKALVKNGYFLHGTNNEFINFREINPNAGAIFLSEPLIGHKSQAEAIAGGPFGGKLIAVEIENQKHFDPFNDEKAKEIYYDFYPDGKPQWAMKGTVDYNDVPAFSKLIVENGYNTFTVYEPAAYSRKSLAVTDFSILKIKNIYVQKAR
jgi:hypothetical protein